MLFKKLTCFDCAHDFQEICTKDLCISFLLLCNCKLGGLQLYKLTISQFLWVRSPAHFNWVLCSDPHKAETRVSQLHSHLEAQ